MTLVILNEKMAQRSKLSINETSTIEILLKGCFTNLDRTFKYIHLRHIK